MIAVRRMVVAVSRFIDEKRLPHLLFYGPPGTGKTSTILACARRLYGSNMQSMVLEVCPAAPALSGMPAVALVLRLLLSLVSTYWRGCSSTRRTTAASTSCVSRSKSLPARGPSLGESPEPALSRSARGSQAPCEVMCAQQLWVQAHHLGRSRRDDRCRASGAPARCAADRCTRHRNWTIDTRGGSPIHFARTCSHRKVHKERALLPHLQLRVQDYPCAPVALHTVPLLAPGARSDSPSPADSAGGRAVRLACCVIYEQPTRWRFVNALASLRRHLPPPPGSTSTRRACAPCSSCRRATCGALSTSSSHALRRLTRSPPTASTPRRALRCPPTSSKL